MMFAQPLWLLAALPVLALGMWLLVGRPAATTVPFLALWPRRRTGPASRSRRRIPPFAIVLIWIALLLASLALAGPHWRRPGGMLPVTVFVDAGSGVSEARLAANVQALVDLLVSARSDKTERFTLLRSDGSTERLTLDQLPASSEAVSEDLVVQSLIESKLRATDNLLIVISDRAIRLDDPRAIRISALDPIRNTRFVSIAAAHDQLMLQMQSTDRSADAVRVEIAEGSAATIDVPLRDGAGVAFVDLPGEPAVVTARLSEADDVPVDDSATLVRTRRRAGVEQSGELPPGLVRLLESYRAARGAGDADDLVELTTQPTSSRAGVSIAPAPADGGRVVLQDHPITGGLPGDAIPLSPLPDAPAGWTVIATVSGWPAVMVRDAPVRQVRIGLDVERAFVSPEAVALLTRCIDYVSEADMPMYRAQPRVLPELSATDEADRSRLQESLSRMTARWDETPLTPAISLMVAIVLVLAFVIARR